MFCSRNKGSDKTVRCAGWSSHVTKSGYIHLLKRDVPIISTRAWLILNSQPRFTFLLCVRGQLRRWRFSADAQARLSLRCSHSWLISWNWILNSSRFKIVLQSIYFLVHVCASVRTLYRYCTRKTFHVQFHEDKQTRRSWLNSLLKCSILRNLMFLIDRNSHYYVYLENRWQVF